MMSNLCNPFPITSVCRDDLIANGWSEEDAKKVTDAEMTRIASKLADDYCEQLFWTSLDIISDYVTEDRRKKESEVENE